MVFAAQGTKPADFLNSTLVSAETVKTLVGSFSLVLVAPCTAKAKALNKNTDKSVCLRVKPNKTSGAIRRLSAGDRLEVIARGKTWSKVVDMQTGRTGYVANDYILKI